ncbi:UDP-N-acetylglucosamine transferase subunit ALG13-like [Glycine soja]|uniref:UDP-N-acetylglucosamine transferase subunit ALG13-like n=1 Tax=Glycine soja TaxID=3848 RepID=A0A445KKY5_GLYSO|nr:UDP-N-acetylglucosamine transferase subunit ALG13-like [Glycine soja]
MMASGGWKVIGEGERVVGRRATSKRAHRNAETGHWKKDNKRKGSGSIFETLRLGKPLVVVVNQDLMDNHQSELAEELADRKHLYCASPQTLHQTIADMDLSSLLPYSPGDATPVAKHINRFLGFPDD